MSAGRSRRCCPAFLGWLAPSPHNTVRDGSRRLPPCRRQRSAVYTGADVLTLARCEFRRRNLQGRRPASDGCWTAGRPCRRSAVSPPVAIDSKRRGGASRCNSRMAGDVTEHARDHCRVMEWCCRTWGTGSPRVTGDGGRERLGRARRHRHGCIATFTHVGQKVEINDSVRAQRHGHDSLRRIGARARILGRIAHDPVNPRTRETLIASSSAGCSQISRHRWRIALAIPLAWPRLAPCDEDVIRMRRARRKRPDWRQKSEERLMTTRDNC